MKVIGILYGEERTFPPALVETINGRNLPDVRAEFVKIGAVRMAEDLHYDVILDRISHDIPYYRSVLQNAMLSGTRVVNNPFLTLDDDKFFSHALAHRMGIPTPRTMILPTKELPPGTSDRSMRNLHFPLDWQRVFEYIGFPAYVKPDVGMGWKNVHRVQGVDEFFHVYDRTGSVPMLLQQAIEFEEYYRCYVIGRRDVHIMPYEPRNPHEHRYDAHFSPSPALRNRMEESCLSIMHSLAYDCNSIEFAVRGGVPYAIDYLNGAPDAERDSVRSENFEWFVDHMAAFLIEQASVGRDVPEEYSWTRFLLPNTDIA